ncbi:hypothetical protein MMH89_04515 [Candidatus Comchoanobacter bicostacola]|uniref:Uncharacterized protein n=1 Tax=Candidatus Comchoanobacter bicostacola TaxID=2919598 RepID=A0ABY5DIQ0_9GAMM|nr:hypothetical protein [Candidatus Comchoanobacter bicostacola]UTC24481.1 hypothetical protein MMH89_04515 [Candidatus Comchoanobacter bicostacola]
MKVIKILLLACSCVIADDFLDLSISVQNDSSSAVDVMFEQIPGRAGHLHDGRGVSVVEWPWIQVSPDSYQVMNGSVFSDEGTIFNIHIFGKTEPSETDRLLLQIKSNQVEYIDSIKCKVHSGSLVCSDGGRVSARATSGLAGHELLIMISGSGEKPFWIQK